MKSSRPVEDFDRIADSIIYIVEDDVSLGEALKNLLRSVGFQALHFESPANFIAYDKPDSTSCVLLDVRLPEVNGLDFQTQLPAAGVYMPVILITGWGDVRSSVRGMKAGAVDYLVKPIEEDELLAAVRTALSKDQARRDLELERRRLEELFGTLTAREREIMGLVTQGLMNKQVAGMLNISLVMVKVHRGAVMKKMGVKRFADLVRVADLLKGPVR